MKNLDQPVTKIRVEVFQHRMKYWTAQLHVGSMSFPFAHGVTAREAVAEAQDRAANLVRGLTDIENKLNNGKTITL